MKLIGHLSRRTTQLRTQRAIQRTTGDPLYSCVQKFCICKEDWARVDT